MKWLLSTILISSLLITTSAISEEKRIEQSSQPVKVVSLRGDNDNANISAEFQEHKVIIEEGGIEVSFDDQPPMIPHKSDDKEKISLTENNCLSCHSRKNYKKEKAPKPTSTHFVDRDGKSTSDVAANRYFCTQCHAPQLDKKVLIGNYFKPE